MRGAPSNASDNGIFETANSFLETCNALASIENAGLEECDPSPRPAHDLLRDRWWVIARSWAGREQVTGQITEEWQLVERPWLGHHRSWVTKHPGL